MTSSESLHQAALRDLQAAGYPLVEIEKRIRVGNSVKIADLVAWGADFDQEFKPQVCVEVKSRKSDGDSLSKTLAQLSGIAAHLGTNVNLLFSDGEWLQADAGFMAFTPVDGPPQCPNSEGIIRDAHVFRQLLESQMWKKADSLRGQFEMARIADRMLLDVLEACEVNDSGMVSGVGAGVSVPAELFADMWFDSAATSKFSLGESITLRPLNETMASIASARQGELVFDPFVGLGGSLIAVSGSTPSSNLKLTGYEINPTALQAAKKLIDILNVPARLSNTDSLRNPWPKTDVIISAIPPGLRLSEAVELPFGSTREADIASIYWAAEALNPGGRAVLLTSRGWTGRSGSAAKLRKWLTENIRITALIGLPSVSKLTAIPFLLVVIDKVPSGDTVIADLSEDWYTQLWPETDLWNQIARTR